MILVLSGFFSAMSIVEAVAQTREYSVVAEEARSITKVRAFSTVEKQDLDKALRKKIYSSSGTLEDVCSSTDNKMACACGDKPCIAGATICGCLTIEPPPK